MLMNLAVAVACTLVSGAGAAVLAYLTQMKCHMVEDTSGLFPDEWMDGKCFEWEVASCEERLKAARRAAAVAAILAFFLANVYAAVMPGPEYQLAVTVVSVLIGASLCTESSPYAARWQFAIGWSATLLFGVVRTIAETY